MGGFGFLMTFLRRYGYSAIGYTLVISAMVVQQSPLWEYFFTVQKDGDWPEQWLLTLENLMNGLFCAGAVMISYGAILGKVSPSQLLLMGLLESVVFWVNLHFCVNKLEAHDVGGGMIIHT